MEILIFSAASLALGIGLAVVWIKIHDRRANLPTQDRRSATRGSLPVAASALEATSVPIVSPTQVVVTSGDQEVMSLMVLDDANFTVERLRGATKLPKQVFSGALAPLVEPLMQAAPSVGTAAMAHSNKFMEVVINGRMLAASDGNGLRAIAKAGKGFEHARLYEPSGLQNVANAAAIWQIASVIVAQKHLADISATLKRVESKVEGIQSFLEESRFAVIKSAMNYLDVARKTVGSGEFLDRTRDQLEHFDVELDRASMALIDQIQRESKSELERDKVGCEGEYKSALDKHKRLGRLAEELTLCNEVRLVNWYLCSVYPDRSKILTPRLDQIRKSLDEAKMLTDRLSYSADTDCAKIDATFTFDNTINERRLEIRSVAHNGRYALQEGLRRSKEIILKLEAVHADRQGINRLIVETKDGHLSAVYLCDEQPASNTPDLPPSAVPETTDKARD